MYPSTKECLFITNKGGDNGFISLISHFKCYLRAVKDFFKNIPPGKI